MNLLCVRIRYITKRLGNVGLLHRTRSWHPCAASRDAVLELGV